MSKGTQFSDAFNIVVALVEQEGDLADACVTLAVHAGIAYADVLCCARLGHYSVGQNHDEAAVLLATADQTASRHLRTLLDIKTRAAYSHDGVSRGDLVRAKRAMDHLQRSASESMTGGASGQRWLSIGLGTSGAAHVSRPDSPSHRPALPKAAARCGSSSSHRRIPDPTAGRRAPGCKWRAVEAEVGMLGDWPRRSLESHVAACAEG